MRAASPDTASGGCNDRVVRPALAAVLRLPIVRTAPLGGDPQSCEFLTDGFPAITLSVRPGLGRSSLAASRAGKSLLREASMADVGDDALWQDTLHEVVARKDDLLCDIQVRGTNEDFAIAADALPKALGAICSKIFAGHGVVAAPASQMGAPRDAAGVD